MARMTRNARVKATADSSHPPAAAGGIQRNNRTEAEANSHYSDPRQQGVGGQDNYSVHTNYARLMEYIPDPGRRAELARSHTVRQVVQRDHSDGARG